MPAAAEPAAGEFMLQYHAVLCYKILSSMILAASATVHQSTFVLCVWCCDSSARKPAPCLHVLAGIYTIVCSLHTQVFLVWLLSCCNIVEVDWL